MLQIKLSQTLLFIVILAVSSFVNPPEPPAGKHWEKVEALSDEFDAWDGNKWNKSLMWSFIRRKTFT